MRLTLGIVAQALECALSKKSADLSVGEVCIDSRRLKAGDLFFCIPGENFDGHDFAEKAALNGAVAVVAEKAKISEDFLPGPEDAKVPVLHVDAAVPALGRLARAWRDKTGAKVVAVTGSAGKTTVKELLSHVLGQVGTVAKNPLNMNNQIGLPLSILAATGEEKYWVMEVGISLPGDMVDLGRILNPDVALVLNVGPAHLSGLGDRGVAYYKAQLLGFLAEGGKGIVNADYPELVHESRRHYTDLVLFTSQGRDVPYSGGYMGREQEGFGRYRLRFNDKILQVVAPMLGAVGAENVTAVAAVAHILGLSDELITQGLATASLPAQRFIQSKVGDWLLVDDSYNANPLSCARSLSAVAELAAGAPLVLVMGEMGELGDVAGEFHRELGIAMAGVRPKAVLWKGGYLDFIREGLAFGDWPGEVMPILEDNDFWAHFAGLKLSHGVILFKGSRLNKLERLVDIFKNKIGSVEKTSGNN